MTTGGRNEAEGNMNGRSVEREVPASCSVGDDELSDAERRGRDSRRDDELRRRRLTVLERAILSAIEELEDNDGE